MAVGANTYGSEAGVELLLGDLVADRDFTATTSPTSTQVEGILDQMAGFLNNALAMAGYTVPVVLATNEAAFNLLVYSNNCGAAAALMAAFFPSVSFNAEGEPTDRMSYYRRVFNDVIEMVRNRGLSAAITSTDLIFAGSQQDADGNTKLPIFTRAKFDFPGARSLTE